VAATGSEQSASRARASDIDVLLVGAGPTGLTLAAQLQAYGTSFRVVDRQPGPVHESRALAVQPRTLEVLANLDVAETMVARGNPTIRLRLHTGGRTVGLPLFDLGLDDTAYPFLLFLSQAETEAVLTDHLVRHGATVERGTELTAFDQDAEAVTCTLDGPEGQEIVRARYVVGCDGTHSTVRRLAGIDFAGDAYPQTFVLADLAAEGLDRDAVHVYLSPAGMLFLFPLVEPAPWRLLAMRPPTTDEDDPATEPDLGLLQGLVDTATGKTVRVHDPVWRTYFRLAHRHAARYRAGRVFLAGDAAHIHSPAGAQGMNTGIQDAWNLGWKLALVTNTVAVPALLDTYESERRPVGRSVVGFTDRAFTIATSTRWPIPFIRTQIAPRVIALAGRFKTGRARSFRTLAQLAVTYRASPAVADGRPAPRRGPRAGDRLPDAPVTVDDTPTTLHRALSAPGFHLLLVGPPDVWPTHSAMPLPSVVRAHRLTRRPEPGVLQDTTGAAHRRLGINGDQAAHFLIRPDGHIAYRAAGTDLTGLHSHLQRWLTP
jgi:2-polyprenyl-6-methoxyphenol hydroxylase-like FAD-dependent oxidoreductase